MEKTTVYLPTSLKAALRRAATVSGRSEAEVIRSAIEQATAQAATPRPRLPLFRSAVDDLSERVDAALAGDGRKAFGER